MKTFNEWKNDHLSKTPEDADLNQSQLLQKFNDYISEGLKTKSSKKSAEKAPSSYKSSITSSSHLEPNNKSTSTSTPESYPSQRDQTQQEILTQLKQINWAIRGGFLFIILVVSGIIKPGIFG